MRVVALSDIHGSSIALDAVVGDVEARGGADAFWVLGDLAAIGPDPAGVLERITRLRNAVVVRGNTDRYLVTGERPGPALEACDADPSLWPARVEVATTFAWTQGIVTATGWVDWLAALPVEHRTILPDGTRVACAHAGPGRDDGRGLHPRLSREEVAAFAGPFASGCEADLLLTGHTHWSMDVTVAGARGTLRMVNTGCVSNPLPPDLRASYVLLEADESGYRLEHRRVDYDREAVVDALRRVNHPAARFIIQHMRGEHVPHWQ